jgi:hypothetical protein
MFGNFYQKSAASVKLLWALIWGQFSGEAWEDSFKGPPLGQLQPEAYGQDPKPAKAKHPPVPTGFDFAPGKGRKLL